jgi:mannose-6-phosphate isomerase-like protein (cupin superfamily)
MNAMRSVLRSTTLVVAFGVLGLLTLSARANQVHATEAPVPATGAPVSEPMGRGAEQTAATGASSAASPVPTLADSRVFRYEDMAARTAANGNQSRAITHGTLRTGESVNLHESTQPAGTEPVALHTIHHNEFICVQEGTLTFDHVDASGKTISETAGPGSVIYVAEGTNHRVRNSGATSASYFVIAIGGDAK